MTLGQTVTRRADIHASTTTKGVEVRHDPDEFSTDLGKNVAQLAKYEASLSPASTQLQLVIVGGLSGRLDQTIHTLHALIQLVEKDGREQVWAIGKESAACILPKVSRNQVSLLACAILRSPFDSVSISRVNTNSRLISTRSERLAESCLSAVSKLT